MRLTKDIVIPAGSVVAPAPYRISHAVDVVEVILGHDKDSTSRWMMPKDDAERLGLIERG